MASTLAAQMYTLRQFTKTPADIAQTLARVKKMGYEAVQMSGHGKIVPTELAKILRGEGLTCCATHVPLDRLRSEPNQIVAEHELWGCKYTAIGGYFPKSASGADWIEFARSYNAIAQVFAGTGLRLGYHNHSHELARFEGKTAMQLLLDHFSPGVWMEIDTYWIQHGGADPAEWIGKVAGRIPCVHLKDMAVTPAAEQQMAEVGEGNSNWAGILAACKKAGVEWYIIEQDECQRDPFESLEISLRNARGMGLE